MKLSGNISLAIVLGGLILLSVALGFWEKGAAGPGFDTDLFVFENIDLIDRVVITNGREVIDCRAFSGGFMVNEQFPMDENLLTVMAAVLQQVRVQRPLDGQQEQEAWARIRKTGSYVEFYQDNLLLSSFWAGGDESSKNSYFATEDGEVYLVHLPGYASYVSELFALPLARWRSRTIFYNTWRSLLTFNYRDYRNSDNDFQIKYNDPFFSVSGVQKLDSNNVMNYLQDLLSLKAAAIIDTTLQGTPWLELTTTDIDPQKNQVLTLYGDGSQPTVLGKAGEQVFSFQRSSLEPIIKDQVFFARKHGNN